MRRADRLFEIIQILRRVRRPISAQTIAGELEVTKRTVYRDISTLLAQGVPIRGEAGVGYVLEDGFDMPPLMLTTDEIDAAVLGAMWVATRGEPELSKAAENLIAKIEAITPARLRAHILEPAMSVRPLSTSDRDIVSSAILRQAIQERRKVKIGYTDRAGKTTDRTIWPVLLGYRDEGRILAAWCEKRSGFRYFRTDRMVFAKVLSERFPERPAVLRRQWEDAMDKERQRYAKKGRDQNLA
ncbi:MAG: HTH domain-containing protein [Alphaproteobacteria bacterium]|nr:HTH domain-containing protein [Alphaproteobacteria bacterium]